MPCPNDHRERSVTVRFRMSPEQKRWLDRVAAESGMNKQDFIMARLHDEAITVVPNIRVRRALAIDFLNIDAPVSGVRDGLEDHGRIEWWREMDRTWAAFGNDAAWNGHHAGAWEHYILSPDPEDSIELPRLCRLATAWAKENFGDYEVAIVYHDDNEGRIPHAHVVVNNTNLATGRRIQEPDPRAVKRSMQRLARSMGLSCFEDTPHPVAHGRMRTARPRQRVHMGSAEHELASKGAHSWVSDIRSCVAIVRMVARSVDDLSRAMGRLPEGLDAAKAADAVAYVSEKRLLPHNNAHRVQRLGGAPSKPWEKYQPAWMRGQDGCARQKGALARPLLLRGGGRLRARCHDAAQGHDARRRPRRHGRSGR